MCHLLLSTFVLRAWIRKTAQRATCIDTEFRASQAHMFRVSSVLQMCWHYRQNSVPANPFCNFCYFYFRSPFNSSQAGSGQHAAPRLTQGQNWISNVIIHPKGLICRAPWESRAVSSHPALGKYNAVTHCSSSRLPVPSTERNRPPLTVTHLAYF